MHDLTQDLVNILWDNNDEYGKNQKSMNIRDASLNITQRNTEVFNIKVAQMYEYVGISFAKLKKISELFGTDNIDVDDYSQSGCESCDYGSSYSHDIQVYNATLRVAELEELATDENLLEDK